MNEKGIRFEMRQNTTDDKWEVTARWVSDGIRRGTTVTGGTLMNTICRSVLAVGREEGWID